MRKEFVTNDIHFLSSFLSLSSPACMHTMPDGKEFYANFGGKSNVEYGVEVSTWKWVFFGWGWEEVVSSQLVILWPQRQKAIWILIFQAVAAYT